MKPQHSDAARRLHRFPATPSAYSRVNSRPLSSVWSSDASQELYSDASSRASRGRRSPTSSASPALRASTDQVDTLMDDGDDCVFDLRMSPSPPPSGALGWPQNPSRTAIEGYYEAAALKLGRPIRVTALGRSKTFAPAPRPQGGIIHVVETFGHYQLAGTETPLAAHLGPLCHEMSGLRSFVLAVWWAAGTLKASMTKHDVAQRVQRYASELEPVMDTPRGRSPDTVHQALQRPR